MFGQVVFSQEYDESRSLFLAKWSGPLRIAIKGKTAPAHRASVKAHATLLSRLSGLDIALAARGRPANVTIFFAIWKSWPARASRTEKRSSTYC